MTTRTDRITAVIQASTTTPLPENFDQPGAHAYRVVLHYQGRTMETPFFTGPAWTEPPTCADVLESLCADVTEEDFDGWCRDLGYDPDSRKALATYEAVAAQSAKLRALLRLDFDWIVYDMDEDERKQVCS